ncbi:hypothetical protein [Mesorhizobium sp.]|uniref:hypothetical protein n=1 Tax=Mesorhizobium sp. TaxID=1871066 RepID=UPI000FE41CCB|nr:hypothetical protein [Mesorhizobium sp.]RWN51097.1 MAG: hypothetical protein EOR98_27985 [Mesorhizobium sp.]RWN72534.1 MAG: hypothetical protein EOS01_28155 [Mesorhizobium sp.]RWN72623.1 MAG: hypothetical protein EOS02_26455 [Mesorhizobium sp.]RWN84250.1 MAG: hypothetical protein EOS04_26370 [Mesorhizobium sp.]RWO08304.1 MAG: hypothetical protein EOS15_29170 [Mesorhizobium sp.]
MDGRARSSLIAGIFLATLVGCSIETIRPGTDRDFFRNLDAADGSARLKQLSQSQSFFTREMTERGASCGDERNSGKTVRVVCVYSICHNGGAWSSAWQIDIRTGTISTPKGASPGALDQEDCAGDPARLKDIQQAAVKKLILAAGEEVL